MCEVFHNRAEEMAEMQTHLHNRYEIIFIVSGNALFTIKGKQYRARRGSLIFISNLETHTLRIEAAPYDRFYALISSEFFCSAVQDPVLSSVFRSRPPHFSHMATIPEENIPAVQGIFQSMLSECLDQQKYWKENIRSILLHLFILVYRQYPGQFPLKGLNKTTEAILAIQKRIDEHCEENFSLTEAARQIYIEMHYLSRLFKEVTGFTFQQYQILQRISMAKGLLLHSQDTVMKIGEASGFRNTSHFIRTFKKMEGVTPRKYRITEGRQRH